MRIYKYLFFLGLPVFAACGGGNQVPKDIIAEDRMPGILAEVHIIDGDMAYIAQTPDSLYKYGMGHYVALFKKYHTDTTQFKKSYKWYTKNPDKLSAISDEAIKILNAKMDSITKVIPKVPAQPATPATHPNTANPANALPVK